MDVMNDQVHLDIFVSCAESGQGVNGVLLDVTNILSPDKSMMLSTSGGGFALLPLPSFGLYVIKPVLYPDNLFCLICDYEVVYTETGVYLVKEPINRLNIYLLVKKI